LKILIDTSVWIDFFKKKPSSAILQYLLESDQVVTHSLIIGELQMGSLPGYRQQVLSDLRNLPSLRNLPAEIVIEFIEKMKLYGTGLSYVDAELLCVAKAEGTYLLTSDKILTKYVKNLGLHPDLS
jgi:predicted nucleic acid-binding protein